MKKNRLEKTFLEELAKTSNISISCERSGLSRQTVYRWMDEDLEFKKKVNQAIYLGVENINDLAESKLISNIKSGDQRPIEYWLSNHKETYMRPRPKDFWQEIYRTDRLTQGGCFLIGFNKDIEYKKSWGDQKTYSTNLKKDDPVFKDILERYKPSVIKYINPNDQK